MLVGVAAVLLAGFVIICAAPFTSPQLYKTGGGLFLVSGTAERSFANRCNVHQATLI